MRLPSKLKSRKRNNRRTDRRTNCFPNFLHGKFRIYKNRDFWPFEQTLVYSLLKKSNVLKFSQKKFLRSNRIDVHILVLNRVYLVVPLVDENRVNYFLTIS